jgi:hypothetical protein
MKKSFPKLLIPKFNDKIRGYKSLEKTYNWLEIKKGNLKKINNKMVKYWKLVKISDNGSLEDEYIPIFFKKKK